MPKGSQFEREISKILSLWMTNGSRDDVVWRTQASGARATVRTKSGKTLAGQYGDLTYTDPIAKPLFDCCTLELKKGYEQKNVQKRKEKKIISKYTWDLLSSVDTLHRSTKTPFEKFIKQVSRDSVRDGFKEPVLIAQRNRKKTIIFITKNLCEAIRKKYGWERKTVHVTVYSQHTKKTFLGMKFDEFLAWCPFEFFVEKAMKANRRRRDK